MKKGSIITAIAILLMPVSVPKNAPPLLTTTETWSTQMIQWLKAKGFICKK